MKKIPNNVVDDIIRLLALLIVSDPKSKNTRLMDRNRRVGILLKKLKKLETINTNEDQDGKKEE